MGIVNGEYVPSKAEMDGIKAYVAYGYNPKMIHVALKEIKLPEDPESNVVEFNYIKDWMIGWNKSYSKHLADSQEEFKEVEERLSFPKGELIHVELVVVDKDCTSELYIAMLANNPTPIAGCLVNKISRLGPEKEYKSEYQQLKNDLQELVKKHNLVY